MNRLSKVKMGFTYEEPYITYQQYNSGKSIVNGETMVMLVSMWIVASGAYIMQVELNFTIFN